MRRLALIYFLFPITTLFAQPGNPNGGGKPNSNVPITGIEVLIFSGALIGLRKLVGKSKK